MSSNPRPWTSKAIVPLGYYEGTAALPHRAHGSSQDSPESLNTEDIDIIISYFQGRREALRSPSTLCGSSNLWDSWVFLDDAGWGVIHEEYLVFLGLFYQSTTTWSIRKTHRYVFSHGFGGQDFESQGASRDAHPSRGFGRDFLLVSVTSGSPWLVLIPLL